MKATRLVNKLHDPIDAGKSLTRCSSHSNQKLGVGMYFAEDRAAALSFAATKHNHDYTHILECDLKDIELSDLLDLRSEQKLLREPAVSRIQNYAQKVETCATKNGRKGVIWKAVSGWVEICLYQNHIPGTVKIEKSELLPPAQPPQTAPTKTQAV